MGAGKEDSVATPFPENPSLVSSIYTSGNSQQTVIPAQGILCPPLISTDTCMHVHIPILGHIHTNK